MMVQEVVTEEYQETDFSRFPLSWQVTYLGEEENPPVLSMKNGFTGTQAKDIGQYKVTRIETISKSFIDEKRVQYIDNVSPQIIDRFLVRKGDILFSHINSDAHIGKSAISDKDYDDLLHGMNLLLIRPNQEIYDPAFLNYVFVYYRQIGVFKAICARAVNQSSINQARLSNLPLPLPPLPEQRAIARVLSTVQAAITKQDEIIQTTQALKKALMHKLFTEGLNSEPTKDSEIGPVPESWEVVKLTDVSSGIHSGATPRRNNPENYGPGYRWLKTLDLDDDIVTDTEECITEQGRKDIRGKMRPVGTVLVAMYGGGGTIGKCGILEVPVTTNQAVCGIETNPNKLHSEFLFHYFVYFRPKWMKFASGTRKDPNISKGIVQNLEIPLPSLEEQLKISSYFDAISAKIQFNITRKQTLESLFRTLLHELMTGQRRVTTTHDEN